MKHFIGAGIMTIQNMRNIEGVRIIRVRNPSLREINNQSRKELP